MVTFLAVRTLDQILASIDSGYSGSRKLVEEKMNALPGQAEAEIAGLDAKLGMANQNILAGARRRGLGFSGIPVAEQAQYAATDYAPAVARTRDNVRTQGMSLQEALLGLSRDQRTQAEGIYNNEVQRDLEERRLAEQVRQFNENLAFQREQAAAAERAAARSAAASAGGGYSLGGGADFGGGGGGGGNNSVNAVKQKAINDVNNMLGRRDTKSFLNEVQAIYKSAGYGNTYDQAKLELLRVKQPGLFSGGKLNTSRINQLMGTFR